MKSAVTNRFGGRAGRRVAAAVVVAAALGLGMTACGPDSGAAGAAGSSAPSAASGAQQGQTPGEATTGGSSSGGASSDASGGKGQGQSHGQGQGHSGSGAAPSAGHGSGGGSGSGGGGVAHGGSHRTIVGKLEYLAPGKVLVKPEGGGMPHAFMISNSTKILGAAAICSPNGSDVTIGDDGYGTSTCTEAQLEKAAKTSSVTVRVTMDRTEGAEKVEEKYHP